MKKLFSTRYSDTGISVSLFFLRIAFGFFLFFNHGLPKLMKFETMKDSFLDPLNVGNTTSLLLVIFAEVFCALLLVMGLLSRASAFVLVILFGVAIFIIHKNDPISQKESAYLYLTVSTALLLCGPGKWSIDNLISK